MEKLNQIINDLVLDGWSYQKNFISMDLMENLKSVCLERNHSGIFQKAAIGKEKNIVENIRSDKIAWIQENESNKFVMEYQNILNQVKEKINQELFLGLTDYECHFAIYPEESFYKPHLDRFKNSSRRTVTFICYLNPDWKKGDGGELKLHLDKGSEIVEPLGGSVVCFLSDKILHEVLISKKERMSLTGWFLQRE